jgi:hypothetical protein
VELPFNQPGFFDEEEEDEEDDMYVDEDIFYKFGYGIHSRIQLSKEDVIQFYFSTHNWDSKDYANPEFSLHSFYIKCILQWERSSSNKIPLINAAIEGCYMFFCFHLYLIQITGDLQHFDIHLNLNEYNIKELQSALQLTSTEDSKRLSYPIHSICLPLSL